MESDAYSDAEGDAVALIDNITRSGHSWTWKSNVIASFATQQRSGIRQKYRRRRRQV